jgi:hypothetical protein
VRLPSHQFLPKGILSLSVKGNRTELRYLGMCWWFRRVDYLFSLFNGFLCFRNEKNCIWYHKDMHAVRLFGFMHSFHCQFFFSTHFTFQTVCCVSLPYLLQNRYVTQLYGKGESLRNVLISYLLNRREIKSEIRSIICKYVNNFGDRQLEEISRYIDWTLELNIMYFTGLDWRVGRRRMDGRNKR